MNIVKDGIVDSFRTLKDNTCKIVIQTGEMSAEDAATLYKMANSYIKFHLSDNEINSEQIKALQETKIDAEELVNGKTKRQRMRNILYIAWESKGKPMESFDDFYNIEMERMISRMKMLYL